MKLITVRLHWCVAIVLTVYGIETHNIFVHCLRDPYVAIVLTVYGIETRNQNLYLH